MIAFTGELSELPAVLTREEVQAVLRCGKRQTLELLASGRLRGAVQIGPRWRVPRTSLLDFLGQPGGRGEE